MQEIRYSHPVTPRNEIRRDAKVDKAPLPIPELEPEEPVPEQHHTIESSKSGQDQKKIVEEEKIEIQIEQVEEEPVLEDPKEDPLCQSICPEPWDRDSNMPPMMMKRWFSGGSDKEITELFSHDLAEMGQGKLN